MIIERSGFLLMASVLAVGGVGGWALRDSGVGRERAASAPPTPVVKAVEAKALEVSVLDNRLPAAACDDSVGVADECPSVGPSDEGVCANIIAKRCADYKTAFKPKVAQQAVACLRQLKAAERCDPARVNLCGHTALMAACPEPELPAKGKYVKATATVPASFTLSQDPKAVLSPVLAACDSISKSCAGQSPTDCQQTLTGMNESGRTSMLECVATHCQDRGLLGCEGMQNSPVQGQARR